MTGRSADARVAEVAAALAPYPWREFTDRMLARRVVGALDRHGLTAFVTGLPGTDIGVFAPLEPADPGDVRVDALVDVLRNRRWRGSALHRLCGDLLTFLDRWQREHERSGSGR